MLVSGRVTNILLVLVLAVGIGVIAMLATRASGGPLDPPAAPSSTLRNIIYQPGSCAGFPIVIGTPGSYLLGADITGCPAKDGIEITTSNVTLDLAGHNVNGGGKLSGSLVGVKSVGAIGEVSISGGRVQGWGGSGVDFAGSTTMQIDQVVATDNGGTGVVIEAQSTVTITVASANGAGGMQAKGTNNRIVACHADYNTGNGVQLGGAGNVVEDCEIGNNTGTGIEGFFGGNVSRIVRNHVHNNVLIGITAGDSSMVEDNSAEWNGGDGIVCGANRCSVRGNSAIANGGHGIGVTGGLAAVDGNHALGNVGVGIIVPTIGAGFPNVVLRNVATSNGAGNYSIGLNNDAGPQAPASSSTSPGTNFDN